MALVRWRHGADSNVREPLLAFLRWWQAHGAFPIKVTSGRRTDKEQRVLYAQGRTLPGPIVTNAPTADETPHGRGAAIDVYPWNVEDDTIALDPNDARWRTLQAVAYQAFGLVSGARWRPADFPHLELQGWRDL